MDIKRLFARYMKVKEVGSAHATLSASGSERWLGCPGSIRLSEGLPEVNNPASIRGTNTHTLLQFMLENSTWKYFLFHPDAKAFKAFIGFDEAMLSNAGFAFYYVMGEREKMRARYGIYPQLFSEKKVELEGVGFGTSDIILYHPFGLLHVMDYKNGTYTVNPECNTQGLYYAAAAADLFGWNFESLAITIIQPNGANQSQPVRTWVPTWDDLEEAKADLQRGAKRTREKNAPLVVDSKRCFFCPANRVCPEQMKLREKRILKQFERLS
jgi:hypothetical protein